MSCVMQENETTMMEKICVFPSAPNPIKKSKVNAY